jgi:Tol biopolymer transport system component
MTLRFAILIQVLLGIGSLPAATNRPVAVVSRVAQESGTASGGSFLPTFSANGQRVVYLSHAANLVTNDNTVPHLDVFSHDLLTGQTELVSANVTGTGGGDANSIQPGLSADGRVVVFASSAQNLSLLDTNRAGDVFTRDMQTGQIVLASTDQLAGSAVDGAGAPRISADGRFVAFASTRRLPGVPRPPSLYWNGDIFVRDLQSNEVRLATLNPQGTASGSGLSMLHDMTADGRYVLFWSRATNLVADGPTNSLPSEAYVRDMEAGVTRWVSRNAASVLGDSDYDCFESAISEDGRHVVFYCATNGGPTFLLHHTLQSGVTTVVSSNAVNSELPQISADGRLVAYTSQSNVFVWDSGTQSNAVVNVTPDGAAPGPGRSHSPVMTPDGRYLCFLSSATNLVTNAVNGRFQVYVRDMALQFTRLVSVNTNNAASLGPLDAGLPAISADGRRIAFETVAADLVFNDFNGASDVFVHDVSDGQTICVSRAAPDRQAYTAVRPSRVGRGALSRDGQTIAFASADNFLDGRDTNVLADILIRNLRSNSTWLVQTPHAAGPSMGWNGTEPQLSGDGRYLLYGAAAQADPQYRTTNIYWCDLEDGISHSIADMPVEGAALGGGGSVVAFQSSASAGIFPGSTVSDFNNGEDVFVQHMPLGTISLVSRRWNNAGAGNMASVNGMVSPNGRWVLFQSKATDIMQSNVGTGTWRIFARDLLSNRTEFVSVAPTTPATQTLTYDADFTPDSRFAVVAWAPYPAPLAALHSASVYDFQTKSNTFVCNACRNPAISDDGKFVAYETIPTNGEMRQVFVVNVTTGISNLVSGASGGGVGNGHSTAPQISPDGRFIIFESKASNLADDDTNGVSDIFIADRVLGTRMLVTANRAGTSAANGASSVPVLSGDGRILVFQSFASDLVEGDFNETRDVFVLELGRGDADEDGMDDDWEVAFFGNLARDGRGDFDGDAQADLHEFRAGTDPTNSGSTLRVLTLSDAGGGMKALLWSAVPGRLYQAQYKDNLDQNWTNLGGLVVANGSTASTTDQVSKTARRFYRVVLAE